MILHQSVAIGSIILMAMMVTLAHAASRIEQNDDLAIFPSNELREGSLSWPLSHSALNRFSLVYRFSYRYSRFIEGEPSPALEGGLISSPYFQRGDGFYRAEQPRFMLYWQKSDQDRLMAELGLDSGVHFRLSDNSRIRLYGNRVIGSYIAPDFICFGLCQIQFSSTFYTYGWLYLTLRLRY